MLLLNRRISQPRTSLPIGRTIRSMMTINEAFRLVPRSGFLPGNVSADADFDVPLPIGFGQTNSQPSTVGQMLEWLKVEPGQTVLDVGSGSGWTTALLSKLVGGEGRVYAVEIIPELVKFGRDNCARAGITNVRFYQASKVFGVPRHAPYDRILVSASASKFPTSLLDQLAAPGKLVAPVGNTIYEVAKDMKGSVETTEHPGYVFVPLISTV